MYTNVSNEFIIANNNIVRNYESRITIGDVVLTNNEVINISFNSMLKNDNSFSVGNCISTSCILTFLTPTKIIDTSNQVKIEFGLLLEDGTYEYVPYGVYNIAKESETDTTTTFIMYDNIVKLDVAYEDNGAITIYEKLLSIEKITGIEIDESVLDSYKQFNKAQEFTENYSCREVLGYIAGAQGGDVYIDRNGNINMKSCSAYDGKKIVQTFTQDDYKSLQYEKDTFRVSKLISDIGDLVLENDFRENGKIVYVYNPILDSKTMSVGNAYWGDYLAQTLSQIEFKGYSMNFGGNLLLDLGDDIEITTRKGETFTTCIHNMHIDYNGTFNFTIGASGETDLVNSTNNKTEEEAALDRINLKEQEIDEKIGDIEDTINDMLNLQSLATNGYKILPNGLILQWGYQTITPTAANTVTSQVITFPITFPKACRFANAVPRSTVPNRLTTSCWINTNSNFTIYMTRTDTSATGYNWFAVGY